MSAKTITFCHICEQNCGLEVTTADGRIVNIGPDKQNPSSWRDFCIKGRYADRVVDHPSRLRTPMRRQGDRYVPASYDEAVEDIGNRLTSIIAEHGADAVASYTGNPMIADFGTTVTHGNLLDAIGTQSRYSVSSVDENVWYVVSEAMHGNAFVPFLPDIDDSDCILLIGANPAISMMNWIGRAADGWRRVLDRVKQGADLIVVDPRRTESAARATLHLAPRPDGDWALVLAVIKRVFEQGRDRIDPSRMSGAERLRELAQSISIEELAERAGLSVTMLDDCAGRLIRSSRPMAIARTGTAIGRNGVLAEWLTLALNFVLGQIDAPGGRFMPALPYSLPDLMGPPKSPGQPSRISGLLPIVGGYPLAELPAAIEREGPGQIKAMIMNAGNPVVSGPDGGALDRALGKLDLFVAFDMFQRESHQHAHWLIPAMHFLEREEINVPLFALAERPFIQATRRVVDPPTGMLPPWEVIQRIGKHMGLPKFADAGGQQLENAARYLLSLSGLVDYETILAAPHGVTYGARELGHYWSYMARHDRKVELAPTAFVELLENERKSAERAPEFPFSLISRREKAMMNSWLAETSGSAKQGQHGVEVELASADAADLGIATGDRVQVISRVGAIEAIALVGETLRKGVVVMPHGWGSRVFDPAGQTPPLQIGVNRNVLVASDDLAPMTHVPRLNGTPVRVIRLAQ